MDQQNFHVGSKSGQKFQNFTIKNCCEVQKSISITYKMGSYNQKKFRQNFCLDFFPCTILKKSEDKHLKKKLWDFSVLSLLRNLQKTNFDPFLHKFEFFLSENFKLDFYIFPKNRCFSIYRGFHTLFEHRNAFTTLCNANNS